MDLRVVAEVGAHGVVYTVVGIATCLGLGALLTRALGVERDVGLLISVGTAICGGSAIAAVAPVLGARDQEVSVALGTIFLLNAVALFLFPAVGHALALTEDQFGMWCALAIHDTSSVAGAAVAYGGRAVEVATTLKLARALWIIPVAVAVGAWRRRAGGPARAGAAKKPWFIVGFLVAAALVTFMPGLAPLGQLVARASKQALVLTLFLIGANLSREAVWAVGVRPLAQGVLLWVAMASLSLGAIASGLIG
jgi:uncharacterized integral membrane protein (TIGR00698 family)